MQPIGCLLLSEPLIKLIFMIGMIFCCCGTVGKILNSQWLCRNKFSITVEIKTEFATPTVQSLHKIRHNVQNYQI